MGFTRRDRLVVAGQSAISSHSARSGCWNQAPFFDPRAPVVPPRGARLSPAWGRDSGNFDVNALHRWKGLGERVGGL